MFVRINCETNGWLAHDSLTDTPAIYLEAVFSSYQRQPELSDHACWGLVGRGLVGAFCQILPRLSALTIVSSAVAMSGGVTK